MPILIVVLILIVAPGTLLWIPAAIYWVAGDLITIAGITILLFLGLLAIIGIYAWCKAPRSEVNEHIRRCALADKTVGLGGGTEVPAPRNF